MAEANCQKNQLDLDGKILQTHNKSGELYVCLNEELLRETLTVILKEDVEKYNCMEPPGEPTLVEEVAEFASISMDGAVMARALEQLGDLHEGLVSCLHCSTIQPQSTPCSCRLMTNT